MSSPLKQNTTTLQSILDTINALPEAGTDLPELSNPADASKALSGYEFINGDGEKVTGTIPTKTASNLTASGATVTVPAGYYATQATKSVATATQATPSVSIDSAGKITASATQTAGYVSAGTKTGTKQLTTQAAKTITPSTSSQTAVAKNVYTTGAVTVSAIPSKYVDNSTVDAVESDVMSGKKFGANGSVKTGTFSLDSELSTQDDLITQIQATVNSLPEAGGNVSVEWKNVFELPTTYIALDNIVNYYIEMPETFNIFVIRLFKDNSWRYNIFSIRDGTNILNNSSDGKISLDHINDGILGISFITSNSVPVATIAEYIII